MAEHENIGAIPCEFLREAADLALERAIEEMGSAGPSAYTKGSAKCSERCILYQDGCGKSVSVQINAPKETVADPFYGNRVVFNAEKQRIIVRTNQGKCADSQAF